MANVQIPNLPPVIAVNGSEQFEAVQSGVSSRVTLAQISNYVQSYWSLNDVTIAGNLTVLGTCDFHSAVSQTLFRTVTGGAGFPYLPSNSFIFQQDGVQGTVTGSILPLNLIEISDLIQNTTTNAEIDYLRIDAATNAGIKGNRVGVASFVTLGGVSGNSGHGTEIYGGTFNAWASSSDGGTPGLGTQKGTIQGVNAVARAYQNSTNLTLANGAEIDVIVEAGSSVGYKAGLLIVQLNTDAVQGTYADVGLAIANQGAGLYNGGAGWQTGISFGTAWTCWPMASSGTLIAAQPNTLTGGFNNNLTAAYGVDFSAATFSSGAFKSTGFLVDGSGTTTAHSLKLPPITAPANPASGFVLYVDTADGKLKAKASTGTVTTLASP